MRTLLENETTLRVISIPKCPLKMSKLKRVGSGKCFLTPESHPLLQSKIINKILSFVSPNEIKHFRLVSKTWNKESCSLLQNHQLIVFRSSTDVATYIDHFVSSKGSQIPQDLPHPHERFHFSKIRMNLIYDNYIIRKFFRYFAPRIRHLQLDLTGQNFRFKFLRIAILESLQHLESLAITLKDFHDLWPWIVADDKPLLPLESVKQLTLYGFGCEKTMQTVLEKLLSCLPNLKCLEAGEQQGRLIFEILFGSTTKNPQPIRNLTHLELDILFPVEIDTIISHKFPLKCLKAELHESVLPSHIQNLFDHLAPTLEDLRLESSSQRQLRFPQPFRPMNFLKSLEIHRFHFEISNLEKFPSLIKVKFKLTELSHLEKSSSPNLTLKSITIEIWKGVTAALVKGLGQICPNLLKLDVPVHIFDTNENIFGAVCENFPNIEELHLSHDSITDESVTGMPKKVCQELMETFRFGPGISHGNLKSKPEIKRSGPWIGDLKRLKILELKSIDLSDVAVTYGIVNCPTLRSLTIHSPYWMTNVSLRVIADTLGQNLTSLDLLCSNQITESAISYLRNRMRGRRCLISENRLSKSYE